MKKLKWTITPSANFTPKELTRLEEARDNLELITNSELFRQEFLRADFSGEISDWKNKSNQEIYEHFMSGAETLSPEKDNEADIDQDIFNPNFFQGGLVGYTYPQVATQWVSRKFFWALTMAGIEGNICHEWTHKLGFQHDFKSTKRRPYSVSYQMNKIIKYCHHKLIDGDDTIEATKKTYVPKWKRFFLFWRY